jgi:myo-inositol-1-phosphate synthase
MATSRIGLWLIGAKGGVATTAITGLTALQKRLTSTVGMVSELATFENAGLPDWDDIVVAGHEIRRGSLFEEASWLTADRRIVEPRILDACREEFEAIDRRIRPGTTYNVGPTILSLVDAEIPQNETPREIVERLRADFASFAQAENLAHVIVVNVASTEPVVVQPHDLPANWAEFERLLDEPQCPLPASSLYAIAAIGGGHSYLNFTPSLGSSPLAFDELARAHRARHYGCDGKTGETLMKSVLAPMFARRNLDVLSWVGHNIFGNRDGVVLNDPANKHSKVASKDHLIREILGYHPNTLVSIEYLSDLGDWKTAWDHIHFRGFLGVPMTLQFTWQGCDSILAAPLVLDMVRFTEVARRRGETGPMTFLASFFKSPYRVTEHCFDVQYHALENWARNETRGDLDSGSKDAHTA